MNIIEHMPTFWKKLFLVFDYIFDGNITGPAGPAGVDGAGFVFPSYVTDFECSITPDLFINDGCYFSYYLIEDLVFYNFSFFFSAVGDQDNITISLPVKSLGTSVHWLIDGWVYDPPLNKVFYVSNNSNNLVNMSPCGFVDGVSYGFNGTGVFRGSLYE